MSRVVLSTHQLREGDEIEEVNGHSPSAQELESLLTPSSPPSSPLSTPPLEPLLLRVRRPSAHPLEGCSPPIIRVCTEEGERGAEGEGERGGEKEGEYGEGRGVGVCLTGKTGLAHLSCFGEYGLAPSQFSTPANVLCLPGGDVVVADAGSCRLQHMSAEGLLIRQIGGRGEEEGQFNYPAGMALDGEDLLVCDRGNCRLQRIRLSDGEPLACTEQMGEAATNKCSSRVPRRPSSSRLAARELESATPDGW